VTLFKSIGIAIEDEVVAARVYELAQDRGVGREVWYCGPNASVAL